MKVRCKSRKKLLKEGEYESLRINQEYTVLAIEFYNSVESPFSQSIGDFMLYRIRGDDSFILPFPAKLFEITNAGISSNWILFRELDGSFSLLPEKWARSNFWEDYYNDDQIAYQDLKEEEKRILQDS
ncbi:hypothetical protein [Gorillibacterium sp. sgz500922]|uniref:hypothetical protein n=1 Tax=Gorillibacterium sp. sgz500922 TaxID=3446694 RepID=UPI003F67C5F3